MLSVFFLALLGVVYGNELESDIVFNNTSGHFAYPDKSVFPNETWTAVIKPPNATEIFIVIEKLILGENDSVIISKDSGTVETLNGTKDPFSLLVNTTSLQIIVSASNTQNVTRKFEGYYTKLGCIYQINDTSGKLSIPKLYGQSGVTKCNFSLVPQFEMVSKLSVTFLQFQLNKDTLQVIVDGISHYNYTGDVIPPEIITDKKLELILSLSGNRTSQFAYESVSKESEYVELNNTKQSHKFIYMPSSVRVYYPSWEECHWVIKSEENTTVSFNITEISLSSEATHIIINDGKNRYSSLLVQVSSFNEKIIKKRHIFSSGNFLWISIIRPSQNTSLLGEVTQHRNGGYRKGSGELYIPSNSTEVLYLLQEEDGENVILNQHNGNLTANSTIYVYNDFSTDALPIITYNTSLPHYPIVSSTSRMMIVAKDFTANANYKANFKGINEGCYKMSTLQSGDYLLSGNCNSTCKWIIPPSGDLNNVISFHLQPIIFDEQDVVTLSLLDAAQTLITNITSHTNELPEFYLPSSSGFILNSIRGNCSKANDLLYGTFENKKGCSVIQKLESGNNISVSSPNFPDSYPLWAHCWTNITTVNSTKNGRFLLTFSKIDLATTHCLRIRDNTAQSAKIIQTYEGSLDVLPDDLILNDTASVEFSAQPCNSTKKQLQTLSTSSGFSLNVLSADCGGKINKTEGNFSTPDFPKNTNATICIWILEVPEKDNIINFTLTKNDSKDFELKIYDGPSIRNETLKNHSTSSLLSRTNSLIFVYRRSNSSQASPGIHVAFCSKECSTKCQNGLCLHEDWKCNGNNDCGDNTDEIGCAAAPIPSTTPAPPPENKSSGVSPVALGLGLPIAFILGIIAAIYLPPLIRRFRSGQYHQFRDVSADA